MVVVCGHFYVIMGALDYRDHFTTVVPIDV